MGIVEELRKKEERLPPEEVARRMAAHERRQVGAIQLASVPSDSPGHDPYAIMLGSDHVVFCTCPSWAYCRNEVQSCKHLERFKIRLRTG